MDVLVLVGKSNKEEKYNILLYERVIEAVGGNFFWGNQLDRSWWESVME